MGLHLSHKSFQHILKDRWEFLLVLFNMLASQFGHFATSFFLKLFPQIIQTFKKKKSFSASAF